MLFREHWQITFIILNRFCPLIKKNPTSLFLMDNIQLDGLPTKIKWKVHTVLCFKYKALYFFYKFIRYNQQIFYFLLFYVSFSADIIIHKFFEVYSTLSKKKDSRHEFSFSNWFTQPSTYSFKSQNLLSVTKVFCWWSLYQFFWEILYSIKRIFVFSLLWCTGQDLEYVKL